MSPLRLRSWTIILQLASLLAGRIVGAQDAPGSIEGEITLAGEEPLAIVDERPPPFRTAVFIERIERARWRIETTPHPKESPIVLRLTGAYKGMPRQFSKEAFLYDPTVVVVEVGQYIQFKNPKIEGEWYRMGIGPAGRAEFIRDPAPPTIRIRPYPFGDSEPFGMSPHDLAMEDHQGELAYPPIAVTGSGRVSAYAKVAGRGGFSPVHFVGAQNPYHVLLGLESERTFTFEQVPPGTYWLRTFDCHLATWRQEVVVRSGEATRVEIRLSPREDPYERLRPN